MKKFLIICLFLSVFFLQACNKNVAARLNGTWQCDVEQTLKEMPGVEALPHDLAMNMFRHISLDIDAKQQQFTFDLKGKKETSIWHIIAEKEGKYTIRLGNQIVELSIAKNLKGVDTLCFNTPGTGQYQKLFFVKG